LTIETQFLAAARYLGFRCKRRGKTGPLPVMFGGGSLYPFLATQATYASRTWIIDFDSG
jgi:hypothetical protein